MTHIPLNFKTPELVQEVMKQFGCSAVEADQFCDSPINHAFLFDNGEAYIPSNWNIPNKDVTIITADRDEYDDIHKHKRYRGTYLHGKMQDDYYYDIFAFVDPVDYDQEGVYRLTVNNTPCLFFLWIPEHPRVREMYPWRGFLVYENDKEAVAWAKARFQTRKEQI